MKTMKWLLRREFWEHKGSMFWAPVVVAVVMLASMTWSMARLGAHVEINGHAVDAGAVYGNLPHETRTELVNMAASSYMATSAPLFLLLGFVVFWYCVGALYDERRDRSILFWKSLPTSDEVTVLSKVITAVCVSPLITIAIATVMSLAFLLIGVIVLAFKGVNVFTAVLASPQLYLSPLALLSLLPVYVVWALPTIGWLLLVSSWARSKAFLWAVGVPVVALVVAKWISFLLMNFSDAAAVVHGPADSPLFLFVRAVVVQGLGGVIPGIWFAYKGIDPSTLHQPGMHALDIPSVVSQSWMTLGSVDAWIGALAGVAMIYGAMRIRRWRDEG